MYSEPLLGRKNKIPAPMNGAFEVEYSSRVQSFYGDEGRKTEGGGGRRHMRLAGADREDVEGEQTKDTQWNVAPLRAVIANWSTAEHTQWSDSDSDNNMQTTDLHSHTHTHTVDMIPALQPKDLVLPTKV